MSTFEQLGKIIFFTGPMYAGKSTALFEIAKEKPNHLAVKPLIDKRYSSDHIVTHDNKQIPSIQLTHSKELLAHTKSTIKTLLIDEVQFFDEEIIEVITKLKKKGADIYVSGLNLDYKKEPFINSEKLISIADEVRYLQGSCFCCEQPSEFTFRTTTSNQKVLVGGKEHYEARCADCYAIGQKNKHNYSLS